MVAKLLNHSDSADTANYDRYGYDAETREALEQWAGYLEDFGLAQAVVRFDAKVAWQVDERWWAGACITSTNNAR